MNWLNLIKMFLPNLLTFLLTLGSKYLNLQEKVPKLEAALIESQEAAVAAIDLGMELAKAAADGKITAAEIEEIKPKARKAVKESKDVPKALAALLKKK